MGDSALPTPAEDKLTPRERAGRKARVLAALAGGNRAERRARAKVAVKKLRGTR